MRLPLLTLVGCSLLSVVSLAADDAPQVLSAHGAIEKVEKDALTIKLKGEGKIEKTLTLKLTGTSRFSSVSTQKRADKTIFVQKDTEAKSLVEKQTISAIYGVIGGEKVLLAAVVQPE